jgi:tetratricopeptide (TPR) repeat protein
VILWSAATLLAGILSPITQQRIQRDENGGMSLLNRLFGSTRAALSHSMLLEADRYFHHGVSRAPKHNQAPRLFDRWAEEISPTRHKELSGKHIEEMMPWLRFATISDPRNVEAYSTTAFWLSRQGHHARVLHVLEEAESNNPTDYRVYMTRGFFFFENFFVEAALKNYKKAYDLWPSQLDPADRQAMLDRAQILTFTGGLYELSGNFEAAIEAYEEVLATQENRSWMKERVARLRRGETDVSQEFWRQVVSGNGITGAHPPPDKFQKHDDHEHHHEPVRKKHPDGFCGSCNVVHY